MNAGSIERGAAYALWVLLVCSLLGCDRLAPDPPPPASRYDIPAAPPGARGARTANQAEAIGEHPGGGSEPEPEGAQETPGPDAGTEAGAPQEPEGVAL